MFIKSAYAQCPICVVTVGGGLIIAKKFGIDDFLVSIWISALNTAFAFWFATKFKQGILKSSIVWSLGFFILSVAYLLFSKQIGHVGNSLWGVDKVLLGLVVGYVISLLAIRVDKLIRKGNNGKVLFPYQKVVIPIVFLLLTTSFGLILLSFHPPR